MKNNTAAIDRRSAPAQDAFFARHGFWTPGIRLFSRLSFPSKALIVSIALVVPLLGLIAWQIVAQFEQMRQDRMGRSAATSRSPTASSSMRKRRRPPAR